MRTVHCPRRDGALPRLPLSKFVQRYSKDGVISETEQCSVSTTRHFKFLYALNYHKLPHIPYMYPLAINIIQEPQKKTKKFLLELDAEKFERLAANFGLFNPDFIESLRKAEDDYKHGRVKKIKSLREIRK